MDSDLAHVSPRAVETVRVIKGPYALAWGAGALSAIQLETFRPPFGAAPLEVHGRVGTAYGSNAAAGDGYAGVWGSGERLRFHLLAQARSGDDYEDGDGTPVAGDYRSTDGRWGAGLQLGEGTVLEYSGGYQEQRDVEYPGRLLDATYFYTRSQALDLSLTPAGAGVDSVQAQLYSNRKDHLMNNDRKPTAQPNPNRIPPFGIQVALPTESNTEGGKVRVGGGDERLSWSAGADIYRLRQTARRSAVQSSACA